MMPFASAPASRLDGVDAAISSSRRQRPRHGAAISPEESTCGAADQCADLASVARSFRARCDRRAQERIFPRIGEYDVLWQTVRAAASKGGVPQVARPL
jgi:hypothetical protein